MHACMHVLRKSVSEVNEYFQQHHYYVAFSACNLCFHFSFAKGHFCVAHVATTLFYRTFSCKIFLLLLLFFSFLFFLFFPPEHAGVVAEFIETMTTQLKLNTLDMLIFVVQETVSDIIPNNAACAMFPMVFHHCEMVIFLDILYMAVKELCSTQNSVQLIIKQCANSHNFSKVISLKTQFYKSLGHFMPLYNRMIAHVFAFLDLLLRVKAKVIQIGFKQYN